MSQSQPTREAVLAALATYRTHVASINRRAMEQLIPRVEAASVDDPETWDSPEEEEEARLDYVLHILGGQTEPPIEQPSDILAKWDLILKDEAYRSGILQGLEAFDCPTGEWEFPQDFQVIMDEVDSLEGAGWYQTRDQGAFVFWTGWGAHNSSDETADDFAEKVQSGETILEETTGLEDYNVAGGWELGGGNEASVYAVYSQLKEAEDCEWSWRYVASLGQFGDEVFNDMVGVLNWYKDQNIPGKDEIEVDGRVVFQL
ncbi:hypothetical protein B0I35DRAFT_509273 [Stachybotrys elegans]|uniref:Uncharacterized protein n=1 Tax=Stachybotrys elegans TaxID=80388 RepID=A0A8K0WUB1_9HYPO|nr:hypothetical protein B0I35DRAFT_509273 [Stachybotrys elegans]